MASTSIPRFLLPRGISNTTRQYMLSQYHRSNRSLALIQTRNANTRASDYKLPPGGKPIVLEPPDKFRPPSHPAKRPRRQRTYNYAATPDEKAKQKLRRYPHLFPTAGTRMHWFLTTRWIHIVISMGTLLTLGIATFFQTFLKTTPYRDMLPATGTLLTNPVNYIAQFLDVYKMHTEYISAQTARKRRAKVDDVAKRSAYRKAHGMEHPMDPQFGAWTARKPGEQLGPALEEEEGAVGMIGREGAVAAFAGNAVRSVEGGEDVYKDFEGNVIERKKRPVKKWLGIWE